jgi:hypothetical protein
MNKTDLEICEYLKDDIKLLSRFNKLREQFEDLERNRKEAIKTLKAFNKKSNKWDTESFSQLSMYEEIENVINTLNEVD